MPVTNRTQKVTTELPHRQIPRWIAKKKRGPPRRSKPAMLFPRPAIQPTNNLFHLSDPLLAPKRRFPFSVAQRSPTPSENLRPAPYPFGRAHWSPVIAHLRIPSSAVREPKLHR